MLTIKEYDDAPTALPAGSPYGTVSGGTMTVNGVARTAVTNANIAHTFMGNTLVLVLFTIVAAVWLTLVAQIWRVRRVCRVPGPAVS